MPTDNRPGPAVVIAGDVLAGARRTATPVTLTLASLPAEVLRRYASPRPLRRPPRQPPRPVG